MKIKEKLIVGNLVLHAKAILCNSTNSSIKEMLKEAIIDVEKLLKK